MSFQCNVCSSFTTSPRSTCVYPLVLFRLSHFIIHYCDHCSASMYFILYSPIYIMRSAHRTFSAFFAIIFYDFKYSIYVFIYFFSIYCSYYGRFFYSEHRSQLALYELVSFLNIHPVRLMKNNEKKKL